jgi:hypothetical protein
MRRRWSLILPAYGLPLFSFISYQSPRAVGNYKKPPGRYFSWSGIFLDTDPNTKPCGNDVEPCFEFNPQFMDVTLAPPTRLLLLTALPAFLIGMLLVNGLGKLGCSQLLSFMVLLPLLIWAWFYFLGWLLDRSRYKRTRAS